MGLLVQRTVGVGMVLTVLLVLLRPHDPNIDYRQVWVVVGTALGLAAATALTLLARTRVRQRLGGHGSRATVVWTVAVLASVAGGVAGTALARLVRYSYGWDAAVVTGFSRELSSGAGLSAYAQDYLSRYPNNVPLVALVNLARRLGGPSDAGMYTAYMVANGVCLALVLLLCFVLVRRLRGAAAGFAAQVVIFVLVGCSPWMAVPYTDLPAMPLVTAAVVAAVVATRTRRTLAATALVVVAFALIAAAFVVKSTPATTAIAIGLAGLVVCLGRSWRGRSRIVAALAVGVLAFAGTAAGALGAADVESQVPRASLDTSRTPPLTWWLANGLTTTRSVSGRPYYGAYSPEMVKDSKDLSGQDLRSWSDRRLEQGLEDAGVTGVAAFEVRKQGFNWGDGMFFAWGEGYDFQAARLVDHGRLARAVQSWQHVSGEHYLLRASLTNGLWLAVLLVDGNRAAAGALPA